MKVAIEQIINAPVSKVWKALTRKEDIRQWSFEMKEFKPQKGFEFQFYGEKDGVKYDHRCKITEAVPEKKLSYSWRYEGHEGNSLVTIELFDQGGKTRVELTHEGLESFPKTPDFARENFVAGWTEIIGKNLKQFLENMKDTGTLRVLLILGCLFLCPLVGRAQDYHTTGFQVSLFYPTQWHPEDYSVDGLRWDIIYGVNDDLQGIDIGMINNARGNVHGLEIGDVNQVDKGFGGVQLGLFNEVKRDFKGVQLGLIANVTSRSVEGFQAAVFYNDAGEEMHGLQLGLVNHTGSLQGIQLGLLNFNDDTRYLGFFPFINAAF